MYMTWVIQVGFKCGTWTQLNQEFDNGYEYEGKSLLWGKDSLSDKLYEATGIETSSALAIEKYDSGPSWMMDGWTIFTGAGGSPGRRSSACLSQKSPKVELSDRSLKVLSSRRSCFRSFS